MLHRKVIDIKIKTGITLYNHHEKERLESMTHHTAQWLTSRKWWNLQQFLTLESCPTRILHGNQVSSYLHGVCSFWLHRFLTLPTQQRRESESDKTNLSDNLTQCIILKEIPTRWPFGKLGVVYRVPMEGMFFWRGGRRQKNFGPQTFVD